MSQLRANDGKLRIDQSTVKSDLTVAELILKLIEERVVPYYVDPITQEPTREQGNLRASLRPLKRLYGNSPTSDFTPQSLCAVRQAMIDGNWMTDTEGKKWTYARKTAS